MSQKTVLIMDDETFVAMDVQMTFEEEGWKTAGSFMRVRDGLHFLLEGGTADFALLDVRLIDGDLFPLADRLLQLGIPFLFHSGHADARNLEERYPGVPLVSKPSLPIDLVRTAEDLLAPVLGRQDA